MDFQVSSLESPYLDNCTRRVRNTAEQYLAVICIERLSAIEKVTITNDDKLLMEKIRSSSELVVTCSGCFPHSGAALKDVFNSEILWGAPYGWIGT